MPNLKYEEVENLAHALWEMRGKPLGSPEVDWLEAERLLSHPEVKVEQHWLSKTDLPSTASADEQFNDEDTSPEEIPGAIDLDAEPERAAAVDPNLVIERAHGLATPAPSSEPPPRKRRSASRRSRH